MHPGDLLVASLGDENHPIARACLYPLSHKPGIVKADCFRIRLKLLTAVPAYVMHVLNCSHTRIGINQLCHGVTRDRVNLSTLQEFRLRIPSVQEQKAIVAAIATCDNRIEVKQRQLNALQNMRKALMQDLLTGKVRVTV